MHKGSSTSLTAKRLEALEPGELAWDASVRGFFAKRNANETVTFYLKTRVRGRQRKIMIGRLGTWTVEKARREAAELASLASKGIEPAAHRLRVAEKSTIVRDAAETFLEEYGTRLKPKTKALYRSLLSKHVVPRLGSRTVESINTVDASALHERMGSHRRSANHVLAVLSKFMVWCETRGWRAKGSNPCRGVQRYKENKRNRYLTAAEGRVLGEVLGRVSEDGSENPNVVAAIWLIIFTGARRNEILEIKWEYVDLDRRVVNLPDSKTGAKALLLNSQAAKILAGVEKVEGNPFVFVGQRQGGHLVNIRKPWLRIAKAAGLAGVRIHDLRHSFGNKAIDAGGSTRVLGVLLGHADEKTTARYAHVSDDRALALAEATGILISSTMVPKPRLSALKERLRFRPLKMRLAAAQSSPS